MFVVFCTPSDSGSRPKWFPDLSAPHKACRQSANFAPVHIDFKILTKNHRIAQLHLSLSKNSFKRRFSNS